ncbi:proteasome activator complex subunit 4-like [Ptychodera flava]|uniref:proteasome activator complex subunit 4-like n=1 Tax=Ptychodera flava TaxID=63121 RepID=UPI003969F493
MQILVKLDRLWEFLSPVQCSSLNNMTVETVNDFAASISIACERCDPGKLHWLFEFLMENQLSGEEGSFADSSWTRKPVQLFMPLI